MIQASTALLFASRAHPARWTPSCEFSDRCSCLHASDSGHSAWLGSRSSVARGFAHRIFVPASPARMWGRSGCHSSAERQVHEVGRNWRSRGQLPMLDVCSRETICSACLNSRSSVRAHCSASWPRSRLWYRPPWMRRQARLRGAQLASFPASIHGGRWSVACGSSSNGAARPWGVERGARDQARFEARRKASR